jgi:deoxyribodipyrimidine photo-lyase
MGDAALFWMRRDIRLEDSTALSEACKAYNSVHICFVFDTQILTPLPKADKRLTFIIESLIDVEKTAQQHGSSLHILHGDPVEEIPKLLDSLNASALYFNRDYEPYALKRDERITQLCQGTDVDVHKYKDQVIFEYDDILKADGSPYTVFTPYREKWLEAAETHTERFESVKVNLNSLAKVSADTSISEVDWHQQLGFIRTNAPLSGGTTQARRLLNSFRDQISDYKRDRDAIDKNGTSNISVYIRHGCISVRELFQLARNNGDAGHFTWQSELIWREFYVMILAHFPHVSQQAFKPAYKAIKWRGSTKKFKAWCSGNTGFPLIDAGMRCLNETGMMHNRMRMIVSSFLCKTLLVDWQKGEDYFALKLLDFDLASNNGGWQWAASTGCDAAPYFRIFNPHLQAKKFDPNATFTKTWCPELEKVPASILQDDMKEHEKTLARYDVKLGKDYPFPITDYKNSRRQALEMYEIIKQ